MRPVLVSFSQKIVFLIGFFLITQNSSFASFKMVLEDFLGSNFSIDKLKKAEELSDFKLEMEEQSYPWRLVYAPSYLNDQREQSSSTAAPETKLWAHQLNLIKPFRWGGEFSLTNRLETKDWGNFGKTSAVYSYREKLSDFRQGLKFRQQLGSNLFGRKGRLKLNIAQLEQQETLGNTSLERSKAVLNLAKLYMTIQMKMGLIDLEIDAKNRSEKRERLVAKKYRDGLKERADYLQARMETLSHEEKKNELERDLQANLEQLGNLLHRKLGPDHITKLELNNLAKWQLPNGSLTGNRQIALVEAKLKKQMAQRQLAKHDIFPTIHFELEYATNNYDEKQSKAISEGIIGKGERAIVASINVQMPLSFGKEKSVWRMQKIQEDSLSFQLKTLKKNLDQSEASLKLQIEKQLKQIQLAKDQLTLARQVLREYSKLYQRGRADLDQVLRAEDRLNSVQNSVLNYWFKKNLNFLQLAYLYGLIEEYAKTWHK